MSVPVIETEKANLELMSGKSMLHILKDVTFRVAGGEVTAVVGPSGSGKTSLLMILGGLERATTGKVIVAGQDISTANEDQLAIFRRKNLGILFQNFHLIPSISALEEVGLGDRMSHVPSALSGGEQQRVGLARAMVTSPKLMLADEPTGNLDQDTGALVIDLMFNLARKKSAAILLITHDRSLAAKADRMLTMNHGQLTEAVKQAVPA